MTTITIRRDLLEAVLVLARTEADNLAAMAQDEPHNAELVGESAGAAAVIRRVLFLVAPQPLAPVELQLEPLATATDRGAQFDARKVL
jgi:hypothetical protein